MRALVPLVALAFSAAAFAQDDRERNMKAFPPPEAGQARFVIAVPKARDESALRVEVAVGRTVQVDAANRHFFGGKLEAVTIEGWGFTRYVLRDLGPMAGTLMAVDPNAPKVERFVTLGGEPRLLRYNSRLPIVVYVPEGVEVRYRVWHADRAFSPAPPG